MTRIVKAPPATGSKHNVVDYVRLEDDEAVEWHVMHTTEGSYTYGYTVTKVPQEDTDDGGK